MRRDREFIRRDYVFLKLKIISVSLECDQFFCLISDAMHLGVPRMRQFVSCNMTSEKEDDEESPL